MTQLLRTPMTQRAKDFQTVAVVAIILLGCSFFTAVVAETQGDAEGRYATQERFFAQGA